MLVRWPRARHPVLSFNLTEAHLLNAPNKVGHPSSVAWRILDPNIAISLLQKQTPTYTSYHGRPKSRSQSFGSRNEAALHSFECEAMQTQKSPPSRAATRAPSRCTRCYTVGHRKNSKACPLTAIGIRVAVRSRKTGAMYCSQVCSATKEE